MEKGATDPPFWFHQDLMSLNEKDQILFDELPPLYPRFFVPTLQDKPQNPIMDSIKLSEKNREPNQNPPKMRMSLPLEVNIITDDVLLQQCDKGNQVWSMLNLQGNRRKLLSWDALHQVDQPACSSVPFLSERNDLVYASARYHVCPRLKDPSTHVVYVTGPDLLSSLKMTVLGISSLYHTWDMEAERFIQKSLGEGERGLLLLDGKDEIISNSVIARFLTIGNLLRRLDILSAGLRSRSTQSRQTAHAFSHALSATLDYLRNALAKCPPSPSEIQSGTILISSVWMRYEVYHDILVSLAELCGCTQDKAPSQYEPLDTSPTIILSHIYNHLDAHIIRQSPKIVTALLAYILTCTSQEYLHHIAQSVGFGHQPLQKKQENITDLPIDEYTLDEGAQENEDIFDLLERVEEKFPSFFPPELLSVLPAAQRSLILLKRADPNHSLLNQPGGRPGLSWHWTKEEIEATWSKRQFIHTNKDRKPKSNLRVSVDSDCKPELAGLRIFDMEPGTNIASALSAHTSTDRAIQNFVDSFLDVLPAITPTLAHLSSLVFSDLLQHASGLSSALLDHFLAHPDTLNFRSHLILLRDFLLITSPRFKSQLSAALFSDREDYDINDQTHTLSLQILRRRKQVAVSTQPWAVGLASALLEREIWPPVGSDLSFFLRTVIVDSLEHPQHNRKLPEQIVADASWRLGFAIRDLPVESGRDRWLNPLYVEALDFLYIDYKPPHPVEILIPYGILSKYQRMFTFLLRLLRVEHALLAVHRMTRCQTIPIFPTLVPARRRTLHFRFVAQSFIAALSGYVFDTVIGGNFDPFLAQLLPDHIPESISDHPRFSDVFELAKRHSALLDNILSACLMRSGQRAAGDLLRQAMETVLEFAIVIGNLRREKLQEYEAAPTVEGLYVKFRTQMTTLTRVLKGLVEKSSSKSMMEQILDGQRSISGGTEALHHLLLRIDVSNWWSGP